MSGGLAAPAAERAGESLMRQLEHLAAGWPADEQSELASEISRQQVTESNCYARSNLPAITGSQSNCSRVNNSAAITGSQLRIFKGDEHEHGN